MSKATIISVMPWGITEQKPGVHPGTYTIPAAKLGDFESLIVEDGTYALYIPTTGRSVRIPQSGLDIANSVVFDYVTTLLGYAVNQHPGIFVVEGAFPRDYIAKNLEKPILDIRKVQTDWFKVLVQIADDDWVRYRQNRMITDMQRKALECLGLKREWNISMEELRTSKCPMCQTYVSTLAVLCFQCNFILDEKRYKPDMFAGHQRTSPTAAQAK